MNADSGSSTTPSNSRADLATQPTDNVGHTSQSAANDSTPAKRTATTQTVARTASIIVLVGFFLPWISCNGLTGRENLTGIQLASNGASGLWIIPASVLVALVFMMTNRNSWSERAAAAKVVIGAAGANLLVLVFYYARLNGFGDRDELGLGAMMRQTFSIEIGAIASLLGSITLAVSGFVNLRSTSSSLVAPEATSQLPSSTDGCQAITDEGEKYGE